MQFSSYNREFRAQVVEYALKAFNTMLKKDADNEQPLYRPKGWMKIERAYVKKKRETTGLKEMETSMKMKQLSSSQSLRVEN